MWMPEVMNSYFFKELSLCNIFLYCFSIESLVIVIGLFWNICRSSRLVVNSFNLSCCVCLHSSSVSTSLVFMMILRVPAFVFVLLMCSSPFLTYIDLLTWIVFVENSMSFHVRARASPSLRPVKIELWIVILYCIHRC